MRTPRLLTLLALLALSSSDATVPPAGADTLLLTDGRTVDCPKAEKQADGSWKITFQNGEIVVPGNQVKDAFLTGAQGYEPKNDEEREKVAKGLVPYDGKWMPVSERDGKLAKKAAETKKRIEEAKAHREWRNRYKAKTANFEFEYTIPPQWKRRYRRWIRLLNGWQR